MRLSKKKGLQQGLRQSVLETLEIKFEVVPSRLIEAIGEITNTEVLKILHRHAVKASSIEGFQEKMKLILD